MTPPLTATWDGRKRFVGAVIGVAFATVVLLQVLDAAGFRGVIVETQGQTVIYRPSPVWLPILALPLGLMAACAVAGLTQRDAGARFAGAVFLLLAVGTAVLSLPSATTGAMVVTPEGFTHTAGLWWSPETKEVRFADLASLTVRPESGAPRSFVLECRRRAWGSTCRKSPTTDGLLSGATRPAGLTGRETARRPPARRR